jgi:hypothetical protein
MDRSSESPAKCRAVEQCLQAGNNAYRDHKLNERQNADPDVLHELKGLDLNRSCLQFSAVGSEQFKQAVLDHDG